VGRLLHGCRNSVTGQGDCARVFSLTPEPGRKRKPPLTPETGAERRLLSEATDRQTAEPAFQSAQFMFQPLSPLSGAMVLSPVFSTTTTSPIIELL
jgi:hypothetical protein